MDVRTSLKTTGSPSERGDILGCGIGKMQLELNSSPVLPPFSAIAYHPDLGYLFEGNYSLDSQMKFIRKIKDIQSCQYFSVEPPPLSNVKVTNHKGSIIDGQQSAATVSNASADLETCMHAKDGQLGTAVSGYSVMERFEYVRSYEIEEQSSHCLPLSEGSGEVHHMTWLHKEADISITECYQQKSVPIEGSDVTGCGEVRSPPHMSTDCSANLQVAQSGMPACTMKNENDGSNSLNGRKNREPQVRDQEGWRWRKQGQKVKKDGTIRCYYRCTQREKGCSANLTIDKAGDTLLGAPVHYSWTARGKHNHEPPFQANKVITGGRQKRVHESKSNSKASSE